MGSLFSSPGKQAQQAAAASGAISDQQIQKLQDYDTQQRQQERTAISGMGANPYFAAGAQMSPAGYQINPADTVGYGSQGPGTQTIAPNNPVQANPYPVPHAPPTNPAPKAPPSQPTNPTQPPPAKDPGPPPSMPPVDSPRPTNPPTGPNPGTIPGRTPQVITVNPGMGGHQPPGKAML